MPDNHTHEWRAEGVYFGPWAVCDCDKTLTLEEVQCRLNATEKLSAEDARTASNALRKLLEFVMLVLTKKKPNITHSELEDYAAALEEKANG